MRPTAHSPNYLHSLDGWRALAVLMVVFDHSPPMHSPLRYLQGAGGLGVRVFFAISGLLICTRLLDEEARYGKISLRNFYIRRVFRILPASLFFLFALVVLHFFHVIPFDLGSWLGAVFFYRNYYAFFVGLSPANWFTSHFWSLSVEEHFYFLLPSILVFFPKMRRWILGSLVVVSFGWACFYIASLHGGTVNIFWYQRTEFCLVSLLLPALYALFLKDPDTKAKLTRVLSPWLGLVAAALCITRFIHPFPTLAWNEIFSLALKSSVFPLVLLCTILHPTSLVTRLLELAPLRFIGWISYSLYLWQSLFLSREISYSSYPIHYLQSPAIGIPCAFACAIFSYYVVETPLITVARRFDHRKALPKAEQQPRIAEIPA